MNEPKNKYYLGRKTILNVGKEKKDWFNIDIELMSNEENLSPIEIRRRILLGINKIIAEMLKNLSEGFI